MYKQISIIKKQSKIFNLEYHDLTYDSFNYINKLKKIEKIQTIKIYDYYYRKFRAL